LVLHFERHVTRRSDSGYRKVAAIHREPTHGWSVAALTNTIGMSRSAFAARFTQLVGELAMR
jgi:AraC-like DNA-binding protein